MAPLAERIDQVRLTSCLNVMLADIDKAGGLVFLGQVLGIPLATRLPVGDSPVDALVLTVAGCSVAPANAPPEIKHLARFVAPLPTAQSVREFLAHFGVI